MCFCYHGFDQGYSINGVLFFFHNLRGKKKRRETILFLYSTMVLIRIIVVMGLYI